MSSLSNILFLDIETVPWVSNYFDLDEGMQKLWNKKSDKISQYETDKTPSDELYDNRAGIFAEFGKIICICVWYVARNAENTSEFRQKSFAGDDERRILMDFFELLNTHFSKPDQKLCGHNIIEFDVPYICRRAVIHRLALPNIINLSGKKPREVNHLDTLEMWKFGDRKSFVSLDLLTRILWLPTPKTDISWEQVAWVYYQEKDLPRIVEYCDRDVKAVAQILMKFMRVEERINGLTD
jgi:3'-5' exonuclease